MILDRLIKLTHHFGPFSAVRIYSRPNSQGIYCGFGAEGEGDFCLDDTARAAMLAFDLYEYTNDEDDLAHALKWMTFVEHMLDGNGRFANFIYSNGATNETGPTSHRGGQWWQCRGMWALAKAYRITQDEHWLDLYWKAIRMTHPTEPRTMAMFNLAKIEIGRTGIHSEVVPTMYGFYYRMGETFAYYQLLEGVLAHKYQKRPLTDAKKAIEEYVRPMIEDMFWSEWKYKSKDNLCPYNVSPIVQGLAALYEVTGESQYEKLLEDSWNWFVGGRNDATRIMYDVETGIAFDGLFSDHAGSESVICAGNAWLAVQKVCNS